MAEESTFCISRDREQVVPTEPERAAAAAGRAANTAGRPAIDADAVEDKLMADIWEATRDPAILLTEGAT